MPNQIENILAEYMEKFGKRLNEQESRIGDELFMWLKGELTTLSTQLQTEERKRCIRTVKKMIREKENYTPSIAMDIATAQLELVLEKLILTQKKVK